MSVGNLEEIIDDNHAIVSTSVGSEHYVSILSFVDKDSLEPGCSVLLNHKVLNYTLNNPQAKINIEDSSNVFEQVWGHFPLIVKLDLVWGFSMVTVSQCVPLCPFHYNCNNLSGHLQDAR